MTRDEIRSWVASFQSPRLPLAQRLENGKLLRSHVPRESHARFDARDTPRRDVVAVLKKQARSRLAPLVPVRHARMQTSPFAFLRGSAALMAMDLARTPVTGLMVQACGDMHVANFGVFASAERQMVFGINDFDETQHGPWEWDLKRLVTSAVVALRHVGGDRTAQRQAAHAVVTHYRQHMRRYARMGHLDVWYDRIDSDALIRTLSEGAQERAREIVRKARSRGHLQVLDKMTDLIDDQHRIIEDKPLIVRATHTSKGRPIEEAMGLFLGTYLESLPPDRRMLLSRYQLMDVAMKVVGVGSVGTRCWVIYLQGETRDDPLFLQVKEAQPSVLSPWFKGDARMTNHGQRVVAGQRLLQGSPDIFLGWGEIDGVHFYVRQLRDMKGNAEFEPGKTRPAHLIDYCGACGWALALAHAKSGDAGTISGYIGKSDVLAEALTQFAESAADQTERDHDTLVKAIREGLLPVAEQG